MLATGARPIPDSVQQATEARLSHAPGRGWAGPTRPLLCVAAVIAVVGAAMAFIGAATTGISGDEDVHVRQVEGADQRPERGPHPVGDDGVVGIGIGSPHPHPVEPAVGLALDPAGAATQVLTQALGS